MSTPVTQNSTTDVQQALASLNSRTRRILIAAGILILVIGIAAVLFPLAATLVSTAFISWLLIFSGIASAVLALSHRETGIRYSSITLAILRVIAGAFMLMDPIAAAAMLILLVATLFLVQGVLSMYAAFRIKPAYGWGCMLTSGVIAVLAGLMIAADLHGTSLLLFGLIVGVTFIADGMCCLVLLRFLKKGLSAAIEP